VAVVCCSIVGGVRWRKMFLGVGGLWEVDGEADLRTCAGRGRVLQVWRAVEVTFCADLVTPICDFSTFHLRLIFFPRRALVSTSFPQLRA